MDTKPVDKESLIKETLERIREINRFMSRSYSQSDPGHMMERRQCRKELEKLEALLILHQPKSS